ncbi:hypothetical protein [Cesiribacter sp. SM1]|uniref:hypothetical protein n=1 Tax=Cesiribacter sp. SM1 TaxID=2861196 RepID=UPI001CD6BB73|nr:hypothetical protein [Cesiribacter sp. SM1]
MNIESNNEILSFTHYLMSNEYTVMPVSEEIKRKYLIVKRRDAYYMVELGALGSDKDGYGIYRIQSPGIRDRLSDIVPITEFDAAQGIEVNTTK